MNLRPLIAALAVVSMAAHGAAQNPPSAPVTVVNTVSNPVPVTITNPTGSVTATVTGAVESADQNVTLHNALYEVNTGSFGNVNVSVNVKDFKEVRVILQRSSCGPCADAEALISVRGSGVTAPLGFSLAYPLDYIRTTSSSVSQVPDFVTKTYTTPGEEMHITIRNAGAADQSVVLLVVGRAN